VRPALRCAAIAAAVFATLSVAPSSARADDEDEARAAMHRGVAAFGRGEADVALREYELAKRLAPAANAPYRYAAEALLALGRHRDAVENLETYLAKNPSVSDASEVRARIATIRAEHFPARVRITVDAPDAVVDIDEQRRGPPATFELAPGKHRVAVSAPGRATTSQDVTLVGDAETAMVISLPIEAPRPDPVGPGPAIGPGGEDRGDGGIPWKTVGWVTLGVSAATLLTTTIVDAAVLGPKITDYEAASNRGDPSARELRSDAEGLKTGVLVSYVVGGILAASGASLVLFAPRDTRAAAVRPWVSPVGAGVTTGVAF
jgi:tetratricopeptide (TPR) repeat protein